MAPRPSLVCCTSSKTPRKPDSCWSWLACAAGTIAWAMGFGVVNCYAVVMPVVMDQFNSSREATAWAGSIPSSLTFATIPLSAKIVSRIDIRLGALVGAAMCLLSLFLTSYVKSLLQMFFSYSILYGLGCSMLFTSIVQAMTRYFKKRQGFALGCVSGGLNLGILTLGPLIQALIDQYGYRSMYRIIASMLTGVLLLLLSFDPYVQKESIVTNGELVEEEEREIGFKEGLKQLIRRPIYVIGVISLTLQTLTGFVTHVHLVSYCKEVGIPPSEASNLFIAIGLSSLLSSVIAGRVIDIPTVDPIHVNQVGAFTMAISMLLLQLATKYYHFVIYSVFLGFGCGILVTTIVLVLLRTVEPRLRYVSFPFGQMFISIGNLTGPPLIGFIADQTGSYKPAFYTAGSICFLAFFISFLQYCFKPCRIRRESLSLDECERGPLKPSHHTELVPLNAEGTENDSLMVNTEPTSSEIPVSNSVQTEKLIDDQAADTTPALPVSNDADTATPSTETSPDDTTSGDKEEEKNETNEAPVAISTTEATPADNVGDTEEPCNHEENNDAGNPEAIPPTVPDNCTDNPGDIEEPCNDEETRILPVTDAENRGAQAVPESC
ncbi:monocarboxylate transporter 13 isoform X2 [Exaiptasia diaphana]|uniref:Major facilitator superfamily (MFS) profile domain-containing protein n=1 Tax=Exaiptasia diaphana TaxID=2652724 RepID=A0A913YX18_EXADI|nr:monocarboxylate transporter 13 isoform X2 [Exaiptasia diaphana]